MRKNGQHALFVAGEVLRALCIGFSKSNGWVLGLVSLGLSVGVLYVVPGQSSVDARIAIIVLICFVLIIAFLTTAMIHLAIKDHLSLQSIVKSIEPYGPYSSAVTILLTRSNSLYGNGAFVELFFNDGSVERHFAVGCVVNVQSNGMLQVEVKAVAVGFEEFVERVKKNDTQAIESIIMRPTMSEFGQRMLYGSGSVTIEERQ